jgi:DNA polymerase-3 subunit epsilon
MTFTAIDFETATGYRNSICQVGLIRVINGEISKKINLLVQPPDNYYWGQNIDIHGITARKTINALKFDQIWPEIAPFIEDQEVVAHNMSFDGSCLKKTLEHYGIAQPKFTKHCTYKLYGMALAPLCKVHGIPLNHHDALSDAMACAFLYLKHLNKQE